MRPARCPRCGVASRQPGHNLQLHGHGRRERQQRGPAHPGATPEVTGVSLRHYQCQVCKAICVVGPADIAPRYLYTATAIAWAIALFGVAKLSVCQVRHRVAIWQRIGATAYGRWPTLKRWLRDIKQGRLFAHVNAGTVSVGGVTWETERGFLAGRKVSVARTLLDVHTPPWIEYANKRYPLCLMDPVVNGRRQRKQLAQRKTSGLDVPFDPTGVLLNAPRGES